MDEIFGVDLIDCAGDNLAAIAPIVQFPASADKRVVTRYGEVTAADFVRSGSATYIDAAGNLVLASADTPRIESSGWLLEGGATNLALWSNSFTAEHGHTLTDCTTAVSPSEYILTDSDDVPRYATILTATANSGRVAIKNISVTSGTKINWSIFVKGISGKFRFAGYDGSNAVYVSFDCATRTFSGLSDPSAISSQLQYGYIGNGWFRLSVTITPTVTSSNAAASIGMELSGNSGYISGSQCTVGPTLSSYIYTESASVTRASEGADTSNNGLTMPLTQEMVDSLTGELLDGSSAWAHVSGTAPAYSGGNRILTYSGAITSSDYHALSTTLSTDNQVEVVYTISGYAAGSVALGFGTAAGATRNANGTYTERGTLTGNTNLYVKATGFTGVLNIISIRRVLDSGQANPGEGTVLCGVYLPWDSSTLSGTYLFSILTTYNTSGYPNSLLYIGKSSGNLRFPGAQDGVSVASLQPASSLSAGYYILISQYSARTAQMRVGLYNPATGALTWSSPTLAGATAYRGFFPITSTGGQRMRWFYGGGNFPIYVRGLKWLNSITLDAEIIRLSKEMLP